MKKKLSKCFNHKCYKTKDDKLHNTIFSKPVRVSQKRWENIFGPEEERLAKIKEWKKERNNLAENSKIDVNAPMVSRWQKEWSYLATGKRMSKKELKQYCRKHGKSWINE